MSNVLRSHWLHTDMARPSTSSPHAPDLSETQWQVGLHLAARRCVRGTTLAYRAQASTLRRERLYTRDRMKQYANRLEQPAPAVYTLGQSPLDASHADKSGCGQLHFACCHTPDLRHCAHTPKPSRPPHLCRGPVRPVEGLPMHATHSNSRRCACTGDSPRRTRSIHSSPCFPLECRTARS